MGIPPAQPAAPELPDMKMGQRKPQRSGHRESGGAQTTRCLVARTGGPPCRRAWSLAPNPWPQMGSHGLIDTVTQQFFIRTLAQICGRRARGGQGPPASANWVEAEGSPQRASSSGAAGPLNVLHFLPWREKEGLPQSPGWRATRPDPAHCPPAEPTSESASSKVW